MVLRPEHRFNPQLPPQPLYRGKPLRRQKSKGACLSPGAVIMDSQLLPGETPLTTASPLGNGDRRVRLQFLVYQRKRGEMLREQ